MFSVGETLVVVLVITGEPLGRVNVIAHESLDGIGAMTLAFERFLVLIVCF